MLLTVVELVASVLLVLEELSPVLLTPVYIELVSPGLLVLVELVTPVLLLVVPVEPVALELLLSVLVFVEEVEVVFLPSQSSSGGQSFCRNSIIFCKSHLSRVDGGKGAPPVIGVKISSKHNGGDGGCA